MYCVSFSHVVRDVFSEDFRKSLNTNPLVSLCQDPPKYETVPLGAPLKNLSIQVTWNGESSKCSPVFEQQEAYSLILFSESAKIQCQLVSAPKNWFQSFSFFSSIKYSGLSNSQNESFEQNTLGYYLLRVVQEGPTVDLTSGDNRSANQWEESRVPYCTCNA